MKKIKIGYVLQRSNYIEDGAALIQGSVATTYGKISESINITGSEPKMFDIANLRISIGKLFTDKDVSDRERVAVLGQNILETLFEELPPEQVIGKTIKVANKQMEIIGVLEGNGSSFGPGASYDDSIFIPYSTAEINILGKTARVTLSFLAKDVDFLVLAMDEIRSLLRTSHKLKDGAADDFRMFDAGSMVSSAQDSADIMTILLTSVAAIVLIVSGIGIMNVMFVTVSERTKEIGIMKAIGAKQEDILAQFLLESIILSLIGGSVGIIIGQITIPILNHFENWYVLSSTTGVLIAFGFSVLVGVFFGFYPALKASKLDPVDALRSD